MYALTLVSERGTDFTKWPAVKQFTSWLGLCPNFKQTGGKVKSSHTRKGKNRAARALRLAAWSLMRSKGYLGAYRRRQRSRLGAPKAITAAAHKRARIVYHLVCYGVAYVRETEAAYAEHVRQRLEKQLRRRAKELGFELRPASVNGSQLRRTTSARKSQSQKNTQQTAETVRAARRKIKRDARSRRRHRKSSSWGWGWGGGRSPKTRCAAGR